MITIYYKTVSDSKLRTLDKFRIGSWIFVDSPTPEELLRLQKDFLLDELILKDALDPDEVPRVEMEDGITYILTRIPFEEGKFIRTMPVLAAIGPDFILTLCMHRRSFLDRFLGMQVAFSTTQKVPFALQFLAEISKEYKKFLTLINHETRRMVGGFEKLSNKTIADFVVFEEVLNDFLAALVPTNVALQNLLSGKLIKLYEDDHDLVEDAVIVNTQLVEFSRATLKSITNIREAYSMIATNDLNRIIKFLTSLTIILAVPTMIASLYGMNVILPFVESPHAFAGILGMIILVTIVLLVVFGKKRWL